VTSDATLHVWPWQQKHHCPRGQSLNLGSPQHHGSQQPRRTQQIEAGGMRELKDHITHMLDPFNERAEAVAMPLGLHFVAADKIFMGTNQRNFSCPVRSLVTDQTAETEICQPVWTEGSCAARQTGRQRLE
jgi:hypothetical protein